MQMKTTRNYYRIYAGQKSVYAQLCREQGFIGADWGIHQELTSHLPDEWKHFNHQFIPIFLQATSEKSKVVAGLACGMLHTVSTRMLKGDFKFPSFGFGVSLNTLS